MTPEKGTASHRPPSAPGPRAGGSRIGMGSRPSHPRGPPTASFHSPISHDILFVDWAGQRGESLDGAKGRGLRGPGDVLVGQNGTTHAHEVDLHRGSDGARYVSSARCRRRRPFPAGSKPAAKPVQASPLARVIAPARRGGKEIRPPPTWLCGFLPGPAAPGPTIRDRDRGVPGPQSPTSAQASAKAVKPDGSGGQVPTGARGSEDDRGRFGLRTPARALAAKSPRAPGVARMGDRTDCRSRPTEGTAGGPSHAFPRWDGDPESAGARAARAPGGRSGVGGCSRPRITRTTRAFRRMRLAGTR